MMTMMLIMMKDKVRRGTLPGLLAIWEEIDQTYHSRVVGLFSMNTGNGENRAQNYVQLPKQTLLTATELTRNKGEDTQQCPVVDPRKTENYQYPSSEKFSLASL